MTVHTIRFNDKEEKQVHKLTKHYQIGFSSIVKQLVMEKIEDLEDIKTVYAIKEKASEEYQSARDIDQLFGK